MKLLFTGNNTKIGQICWDAVADFDRTNCSRTTNWNLDYTERVDELLNEEFDMLVSVAKTNQYYMIQKFYEQFKDTDKRLFVFGSRAFEWSGKHIPHHGMKYAIDKKQVHDAVRFIQNDSEKKCVAQIMNVGKADHVEPTLAKHFRYMIDNPEILELSFWGI